MSLALANKYVFLQRPGNCNPRLPAAHFQVKKEGPNTGRWFYTCQEPKDGGCGFFLWDDIAKGREAQAVINNTRSEADHQLYTPSTGARDKNTVEGLSAASNKWMADLGKVDEDEFGDWSLSRDEERKLVQVAVAPETPRKATKTNNFVTPGSKRKWAEDTLPTPVTRQSDALPNMRRDEEVFFTPASKLVGGMWDGKGRFRSPSHTPTPGRYHESTVTSETSQDRTQNMYDISDEVTELLKDQGINEETTINLKQLLNRHALKISGIAKGRDITRVALKAKDSKIAELQQRISALETEREMDKTIIRHFKSDMAHSIEKKHRRGKV